MARPRPGVSHRRAIDLPTRTATYHRRVTRYPDGFDVVGPVQAEVFVVWLAGDHLELTGPCGPAPWLLQLGPTDHPVEVVTRIVRDVVGEPLLVHSSSWSIRHWWVRRTACPSCAATLPVGMRRRRRARSRRHRSSNMVCATWPG